MTADHSDKEVTAALVAEAAAWLAILHGPNRTADAERGFSQWLQRSAAHSAAFEEATDIWEEAQGLPHPGPLHGSFRPRGLLGARSMRLVVAATVAALAIGAVAYFRWSGVATDVGELRLLALEDGTRIVLNTDTRVVVSYGRDARRVELKEGEAVFEVARRPGWPFVVTAGDRRIEALGTSFAVRRDGHHVAVTLVEGKVAVTSTRPDDEDRAPAAALLPPDVVLAPGERASFARSQPVKKDRPQVEKLLAWQRREIAFDDVALADAVAEMNRYSRKPLRIAGADAAHARVTGLFRAGDSLSFARAVGEAFRLHVAEEGEAILLSSALAPGRVHPPDG